VIHHGRAWENAEMFPDSMATVELHLLFYIVVVRLYIFSVYWHQARPIRRAKCVPSLPPRGDSEDLTQLVILCYCLSSFGPNVWYKSILYYGCYMVKMILGLSTKLLLF
jgi:hypothetical protein